MPEPLVGVVVRVPALGQAVPGDVDGRVLAQCAGEEPHEADTAQERIHGGPHDLAHDRPVRIAAQTLDRRAVEVRDGGTACSAGDGKPRRTSSRISAVPRPVGAEAGTTGKNEPRATAFSRSPMIVSRPMSSPPR
ncbi:hypothetical protein SA2016_0378 [Sinomonas atrocyanea]|uniref:Uncharacterized protein n=1 Tax=Sinomonas atrocyanea TaxID=37927 RepID=A0A126ZW06_9MICC|nr:hypothetical protein SA2016_0378 [Sinomonas atrocyanea]